MEKTRLAICIEDEEYQNRFVKCLMNHYKELFEIHVMHQNLEEQDQEFGAIITGDGKKMNLTFPKKTILLVLQENGFQEQIEERENVYYTKKYQEVYKIVEELQKAIAGNICVINQQIRQKEVQRIGVISLVKEAMQIPFAALLAEILGEEENVLLVDLQAFSGLTIEMNVEDTLGMEDLITIATTENYTANRVAASIGHEQKWDYIYPIKNTSCLTEVGYETYQKMLDIVEKERNYDYEIINFGSMFPEMIEFMESCHQLFFLTEKKEERNWREQAFLTEMNRRSKENILKNIIWMEIPTVFVKENTWMQLMRNWLWSELGDQVREMFWMVYKNGTKL